MSPLNTASEMLNLGRSAVDFFVVVVVVVGVIVLGVGVTGIFVVLARVDVGLGVEEDSSNASTSD